VLLETLRLYSCLSKSYAETLRCQLVGKRHYKRLIVADADVYKPNGQPLLKFRKAVLSAHNCRLAFPALIRAATPSLTRGDAAGKGEVKIRRSGKRSLWRETEPVLSGLIGAYDKPACRTTRFTADQVKYWFSVLPLIREVDRVFRATMPDRHAAQMLAVKRTPPQFIIADTSFTTVTVNRNWRTLVHRDAGDLKEGFGVMSVLDAGKYTGGYLIFPRYEVAVDMRCQDVLMADVHELHGNSPLVGKEGEYERIACVFYYRSRMAKCAN
jgi:hypothetical protein